MAGNDVRVRLSPEGVREVQQALRRVQRESDKVNRESARGVNKLTSAITGLSRVARGLGITAVGTGVVALARNAGDAADAIQKLQLRVGGTAEDLSALAFLTRTNDVEFTQLVATLGRIGERYDLLKTGNADVVRQFRTLGLTFEDIEDLSVPEILELIAQRMAALPSSIERSRVAVRLFGRSGNQLIPLLLDLAQRGLPGAGAAARAFGLEFSQAMVDAAAISNDQLALVDARVDGLATQFRAGFLPQILAATGGGVEGFQEMAEAAQTMGQVIGQVIRTFVAALAIPVNFVTAFIRARFRDLQALSIAGKQILDRDFSGAALTIGGRLSANVAEIKDAFAGIAEDAVDAFDAVVGNLPDLPEPPDRSGGGGGGDGIDDDLAKIKREEAQRLQVLRAGLQAEASVRAAQRQRDADADQRLLDAGLLSLQEFLDRRVAAVRAAGDEQVRDLTAQIDALRATTSLDPQVRASQIAAIEAQIAVARINTERELDALSADRVTRELAAKREVLSVEEELLGLEGRREEAARLALQAQTAALRERLRAAGQSASTIDALVSRFENASLRRLNFDEVVRNAESAFTSLENARTRIEQDVQLGITTQLGAQQRILQLEQARLPVLRQIAEASLEAARATGDPALIAQAEQLALRVQQVAVSVELASNSFARFRDQAEQAAENQLTEFLANGIQQADSLKDAIKQLARSVIDDLKRIAAQALATSIVRGVSGAFGNGAGAVTAAGGGLLSGPGSGTSDSIAARVSNGEFIVRAASVAQPGVLPHLFELNRKGARALQPSAPRFDFPRFNEGGLAQTDIRSPFRGSLEVGLADGLELRNSPVVNDATILEIIRRHPRQITEALGR